MNIIVWSKIHFLIIFNGNGWCFLIKQIDGFFQKRWAHTFQLDKCERIGAFNAILTIEIALVGQDVLTFRL